MKIIKISKNYNNRKKNFLDLWKNKKNLIQKTQLEEYKKFSKNRLL